MTHIFSGHVVDMTILSAGSQSCYPDIRTIGGKASPTLSYSMFSSGLALNFPGVKEPDSFLDYSWDASDFLDPIGDYLLSVSVSVSPWGTGELAVSNLSVEGDIVTFWLGSGIAGRPPYIIKIEGSTLGGRVFEWCIGLRVDPSLALYPFPRPPLNNDFSTPITWVLSPGFNLINPLNSGYIALLAGF